jgi:hypothetical protein
MLKVFLCFIHHREESEAEIPQYVQRPSSLLAERTTEEKTKCCFLHTSGAEHTSLVISFQLVPLPFENVSYIEHVHQEEPTKDFYLVCAFRILDPNKSQYQCNVDCKI